MTINDRLFSLRQQMQRTNTDALIIPTADFHGSEYICAHFKAREYFSGFDGSAGTLLVLNDSAYLFTDGRYFIAAEKVLSASDISLMKIGVKDVPTISELICDTLSAGQTVCIDARLVSAGFYRKLKDTLSQKDINLKDADLADAAWQNRPEIKFGDVFLLDLKYSGQESQQKLDSIYGFLDRKDLDMLILSLPEEISWLLNLRGDDIEYTPVFLSFMIVSKQKSFLFANQSSFSEQVKEHLASLNITLLPYFEFFDFIKSISQKRICADFSSVSERIVSSVEAENKCSDLPSPVSFLKAVKSEVECENMKKAHLYDALAAVRFIRYLKSAAKKANVTEFEAAQKFTEIRKGEPSFLQNSFEPIIAFGENGAIVHYSPSEKESAVIKNSGFCLCDTGGHYLYGTTDITRTVALGHLSFEQKKYYTLVTKANLDLSMASFKKGVAGESLDVLARLPLWNDGVDYRHSTGHGVGYLLSVHESPPNISCRTSQSKKFSPLEENMIFSNEPGVYFEGRFGIRLENLMRVYKKGENEYGSFLGFETLTLVPFERKAIIPSMLSSDEKAFLNAYHKKIYDTLSPFLNPKEKRFLKKQTAKI